MINFSSTGIRVVEEGRLSYGGGNVLDGVDDSCTYGMYADRNGTVGCYSPNTENYIRDCNTGVRAESGGIVTYTSDINYDSNTTADEDADGASFGYID